MAKAKQQLTRKQLITRRELHWRNAQEAQSQGDRPKYSTQLKLVVQIDRAIKKLGAE